MLQTEKLTRRDGEALLHRYDTQGARSPGYWLSEEAISEGRPACGVVTLAARAGLLGVSLRAGGCLVS